MTPPVGILNIIHLDLHAFSTRKINLPEKRLSNNVFFVPPGI